MGSFFSSIFSAVFGGPDQTKGYFVAPGADATFDGVGVTRWNGRVILAMGCFWCGEHDFDVIQSRDLFHPILSGYIGSAHNAPYPSYSNYVRLGYKEAVEVKWHQLENENGKGNAVMKNSAMEQEDKSGIPFSAILYHFWTHVDPLDAGGQFCDRGQAYTSAIYCNTTAQCDTARASKEAVGRVLFPPPTSSSSGGMGLLSENTNKNGNSSNVSADAASIAAAIYDEAATSRIATPVYPLFHEEHAEASFSPRHHEGEERSKHVDLRDHESQDEKGNMNTASSKTSIAAAKSKDQLVQNFRFYPAEAYHQQYWLKKPGLYAFYRKRCGRDARLQQLWTPFRKEQLRRELGLKPTDVLISAPEEAVVNLLNAQKAAKAGDAAATVEINELHQILSSKILDEPGDDEEQEEHQHPPREETHAAQLYSSASLLLVIACVVSSLGIAAVAFLFGWTLQQETTCGCGKEKDGCYFEIIDNEDTQRTQQNP
ncbi:unnamed protein product [Amoebophrya sp. A25]|nr:unnamed protein product [Amoebophrya sp. A25]|eukprot:GSA25T00006000001.1